MTYKSIIFDLDGTLLDTAAGLADSANYVLSKYGFANITPELTKEYAGNGSADYIARCLPNGYKTPNFEVILTEYRARYAENPSKETSPYPGILKVLESLKSMGVTMSIVSNKPDNAVKSLNNLFFKEYMTAALGETPETPRKPAPDMLLSAIEQMRGSKSACLYVGDSEVDIETAANAGIKCVCVSWGFRSVEVLRKHGAEIIVERAEELLKFIK